MCVCVCMYVYIYIYIFIYLYIYISISINLSVYIYIYISAVCWCQVVFPDSSVVLSLRPSKYLVEFPVAIGPHRRLTDTLEFVHPSDGCRGGGGL